MGGRGTSGERNHRESLENSDFDNLDEYDEEVLNDQALRSDEPVEKIQYTESQIKDAVNSSSRAIKSGDEDRILGNIRYIETMLDRGNLSDKDIKRLNQALNKLTSAL